VRPRGIFFFFPLQACHAPFFFFLSPLVSTFTFFPLCSSSVRIYTETPQVLSHCSGSFWKNPLCSLPPSSQSVIFPAKPMFVLDAKVVPSPSFSPPCLHIDFFSTFFFFRQLENFLPFFFRIPMDYILSGDSSPLRALPRPACVIMPPSFLLSLMEFCYTLSLDLSIPQFRMITLASLALFINLDFRILSERHPLLFSALMQRRAFRTSLQDAPFWFRRFGRTVINHITFFTE